MYFVSKGEAAGYFLGGSQIRLNGEHTQVQNFFFFQAEDGIRDRTVTGVQTCALPIWAHGIVFIGPTPEQMRDFGLKHVARRIAAENGVPLLPGSGLLENIYAAVEAA